MKKLTRQDIQAFAQHGTPLQDCSFYTYIKGSESKFGEGLSDSDVFLMPSSCIYAASMSKIPSEDGIHQLFVAAKIGSSYGIGFVVNKRGEEDVKTAIMLLSLAGDPLSAAMLATQKIPSAKPAIARLLDAMGVGDSLADQMEFLDEEAQESYRALAAEED